jgi:hypothetical protein
MPTLVDTWVEKGLLVAIKASGESRDELSLVDICDSQPALFGEKGDLKRRNIQFHFNNLKRKSIRSYAAYLDKFEVAHGVSTVRLLRQQGQQPSPESVASSAADEPFLPTSEAPPAPEQTQASQEASEPLEDILSSFKTLSVAPHSPPPPARRLSYPTPATPTMNSPPWQTPSKNTSSSASSDPSGMNGSKANPWIIYVDCGLPERNREFDIEYVPSINHGKYVRPGFHIQTNTSHKDQTKWSASMVDSRRVLIKGPSRSDWFNHLGSFHRRDECQTTKDRQTETSQAIKKNEDRQIQYWLLIFDATVTLDNVILSGDPIRVTKNKIAITADLRPEADGTKVVALTVMVYWKIAMRDGGYLREEEDDDDSLSDLMK